MLLVVPCLVAMVVDQSNQLGINKTWLLRHTRVILLHNSRVWGVLVSMNCSSLWSARRIREILHCARDLMRCSGNANLEMVRSVRFNLLFFYLGWHCWYLFVMYVIKVAQDGFAVFKHQISVISYLPHMFVFFVWKWLIHPQIFQLSLTSNHNQNMILPICFSFLYTML